MNEDAIKAEVNAWLEANWDAANVRPHGVDANDPVRWNEQLLKAGWLAPRWSPELGGRNLTDPEAVIVEQAFRAVGAPGCGVDRTSIAANTLLSYGQKGLCERLIHGLLTGALETCLLYSEPGAGSDLASLRTRAERNGDHYIVNGQKLWTTGARAADYGLLLARTDWDVPKHSGISFFLCPMKQPGIDIRPLYQITGESHFNEVFLENVTVPTDHLLGNEGDGWKILQTALAYERLLMGEGGTERRPDSTDSNEADLIAFAREAKVLDDPVVRQQVSQAVGWRRLNALNGQRAQAEQTSQGGNAVASMSLGKLAMSRILHNDARVMTNILGADAMLDGEDHAAAEDANYRSLHAYMNSIAGGTDQIQRNIIAERVLGLPRDIDADRNIPFRQSAAVRT